MIVTEIIMKLNIVQGLYIVLRQSTNSRKIPDFHRGGGGAEGSSHKIPPQTHPVS